MLDAGVALLRHMPFLVHALAAEHLLLVLHQDVATFKHRVDEAQLVHSVGHVDALRVKAVTLAAGDDSNAANRG